MGSLRKTETMQVRIPAHHYLALKAIAEAEGRFLVDVLGDLLVTGIARHVGLSDAPQKVARVL